LPSKVAVHPNWVDTDFFKPLKNKKNSETKNKKFQILFVGRGLQKKGLFLFGELAQKNPNLRFLTRVGEGPDLQRFLETYKQIQNLEIRTPELLPVDFNQKMNILREEYQSSDIFIMPSVYSEGFAAVVLEAASSGLAIISSNLGCLPDMLSGSGAVLVPPTINNFNFYLRKIARNNTQILALKTKMRNFALQNFSDKNAEIIYQSYRL